ncbi:gibberellin-regulated protein 1-like isoform X1 [Macadamia integrifolia]|uniref:gibberellin-regulated protein 1-like isoform X1 n=1 Tax=Macadamia integrifolia TaxID=60698 RepID=UPI001C4F0335|nr:gibberellin-regulated protein 1-like isoform X1 [Macadamia integrifolia]
MAVSKVFVASLVLFLLVLHLAEANQMLSNSKATTNTIGKTNIDCAAACTARCRLASRQRLCHRACGTCCARCNCVPPGTSGNEDVCPCYATMTTHGGRHKCP